MYGVVPPVAFPLAVPLQSPKQVTFVEEAIDAVGDPALGTVTLKLAVHPLASVTVTAYVPAARPVAVCVV